MVRARRSSKAPATRAPLPLRLQPVIASFFGSIPICGLACKASIIRETPQDHATLPSACQTVLLGEGRIVEDNGRYIDTLTLKLISFPPLPVVMLVALEKMDQFFSTTCPLLFCVYVPAVFELERVR
ncbi:hypothetical protein KC349_g211 [Hortaea werneckii]|nr:hypothetical protein KC349_g211 [Hortaea werneckii]